MFMDLRRERHKKVVHMILMDSMMVLAIIGLLCVFWAIVTGWRVEQNLRLEQKGLLRIETKPQDAEVKISRVNSRYVVRSKTDMSKMLKEGKYEVELTKSGYFAWKKRVKVDSGWMTDLTYVKLFKQKREAEKIKTIKKAQILSVAPMQTQFLYFNKMKNKIHWVDFTNGQVKDRKMPEKWLNLELRSAHWDKAERKVLINGKMDGKDFWHLLDLENEKNNHDLTQLLEGAQELSFKHNNVVFLKKDQLFEADVNKAHSRLLAEKVEKWNYNEQLVFSVLDSSGKRSVWWKGDSKSPAQEIKLANNKLNIDWQTIRWRDQDRLILAQNKTLYVYDLKRMLVNEIGDKTKKKINWNQKFKLNSGLIGGIKTSHKGRFTILNDDERKVVFDADLLRCYQYDNQLDLAWMDEYILYGMDGKKLKIYDFDGTNERVLFSDKKRVTGIKAIARQEEELYYLSENAEKIELVKEKAY